MFFRGFSLKTFGRTQSAQLAQRTLAPRISWISAPAICEHTVECRQRRTISTLQVPGTRLPFAVDHGRADAVADTAEFAGSQSR